MIKGAAIKILRVVEKKLFIASFTTSMSSLVVLFGKNPYLRIKMRKIIAKILLKVWPRSFSITLKNNITDPTSSNSASIDKRFFFKFILYFFIFFTIPEKLKTISPSHSMWPCPKARLFVSFVMVVNISTKEPTFAGATNSDLKLMVAA